MNIKEQLKQKVISTCLYCKKKLTDKEIDRGLKHFEKHAKVHLQLPGRIALWCDECDKKIKNGELKPLGGDLND